MFTQTQGPAKARVDLEVNLRIKVEVEVKAKVEVKVKVEIKVETGDLCLQMKVVCIGFHSLAVFILRICINYFSSGEKMQEEGWRKRISPLPVVTPLLRNLLPYVVPYVINYTARFCLCRY